MADDAKTDAAEPEARAAAPEKAAGKPGGRLAGKWAVFWLVAGLSLVADQATKIWARAELPVIEVARASSPETSSCDVPEDLVPPEK